MTFSGVLVNSSRAARTASSQPWDNLRKDLSGRRKGKRKGSETGTGLVCIWKKTKGQERKWWTLMGDEAGVARYGLLMRGIVDYYEKCFFHYKNRCLWRVLSRRIVILV